MSIINSPRSDFRKWIIFNKTLSNHQHVYDLYHAVRDGRSRGAFEVEPVVTNDTRSLVIQQEEYPEPLTLGHDGDRPGILEYLKQNYFVDGDIEAWYLEQQSRVDRQLNLNASASTKSTPGVENLQIHPKESFYLRMRIFFSFLFYFLIAAVIGWSFLQSQYSGVIALASLIFAVALLALGRRIAQGYLVGLIKGNAIRLHEEQYPEIYDIVRTQSEALGLKEIPEVYVYNGHFNAFVTKLARKKYLLLFSEVIETAMKGDYEVLRFVVGHELGHIKRRHLTYEPWLLPSSLVPFLRAAHSRGCEYTCDRIGFHFSGQGSLHGILILATGKEIVTKMNLNQYIKDIENQDSFWVWFSEKFLSHPHTFNRMAAIKKYAD